MMCFGKLAAAGLGLAWGALASAAEPAGCVLSLASSQTGHYVMRNGDVVVVNAQADVAKGVWGVSPWYDETFGAAQGFTLALRVRATEAPNTILASLGAMRAANESLMLATDGRDRLQLAVVAGASPRVVRKVAIPVADVRREHALALRCAADGTVTAWVDGKRTGAVLKFACTDTRLQLLGGYNKQKELGEYAHGCSYEGNVIVNARLFARPLADAEITALAPCVPGPAPSAPAPRETVAWPALKHYDADHIQQVELPLGGIGTGTIGLTGRGELNNWELFNNPSVKVVNERPQFAITARGAKTPAASVLLAGPVDDHQLQHPGGRLPYAGYPRFRDVSFDAAFPFGIVHLSDPELPYRVDLKAFSPFIPGDSAASSTPVASLEYVVENLTDEPLTVSISGFGRSAVPGYHAVREGEGLRGLETVSAAGGKRRDAGSYMLVTDTEGEVSYRTSGIPNNWCRCPLDFWDDFTDDGRLQPRERFGSKKGLEPHPFGALCVSKTVPAHGKTSFRFAYTWRFPNRYGWSKTVVGNWYAKNYVDTWDAARKIWPRLNELERRTAAFVTAFLSSDEPAALKDAALNNLSVMTSQTVFRDREGRYMGYEGMGNSSGWCFGTTTHVWNYEFATAALFGDLARTQRENEFVHATRKDGWMAMRFRLPLERQVFGVDHDSRVAADGQMGCIMKAYREWKWSGDTAWLKSVWPKVKAALAFAWTGAARWDADADGVMEGEQHNTFDINFYGPNPLCEFWYLGALRAGEEMAKAMGDAAFAATCRRLFASGSRFADERMFNGEYYWQLIPEDRKDEIFQLGRGCLSDQLLGQQAAHLVGLGDLASRANARKACESIMKYNFKASFMHHFNNMRIYSAGRDAGLLIASWPLGGREKFPVVYFSEVWTGIEYVAAAEMVFQGMDAEALKIVSSARARHDGSRRNPFNEFECGYHYARSLAAWNVHLAWTGFQYDALAKRMTFGRDGTWFWSNGTAWGTATVKNGQAKIKVIEGKLP